MSRALFRYALLVLALATIAAGCGSGSGKPGKADTVAIKHSLGTSQVPAAPKRIVALSLADEDALTTLGITPVGYLGYQREGLWPWQKGAELSKSTNLDEVGQDEQAELNFERLASLRPDLILATEYWQIDKQYRQLSRIAPTVAPVTAVATDSWQTTARLIAKAVGKTDAMEEQIGLAEGRVDRIGDKLPGLRGKSYADAYYWGPADIVVNADPAGGTAKTLDRLGMKLSSRLVGEVNPSRVKGAKARRPLSLERLDLLDSDLLLMSYASESLRKRMQGSRSYRELAVARDGRTQTQDRAGGTGQNNPTILSVPWGVEQMRPVLERVAKAE